MDPANRRRKVKPLIEGLRREARSRPRRRPFPPRRTVRRKLNELKALSPEPRGTGHPWIPEPFVRPFEVEWRKSIRWYVVVDDIDEGVVVFSAVGWPTLDGNHRLVFPDQEVEPFDVPVDQASGFFAAHRSMIEEQATDLSSEALAQLRTRPLRAGDVFAMSQSGLRRLRDPETASAQRGPILVFDVTREAREAAKVAYYAAAANTIDPEIETDRQLAEVIWRERRTHEGREQEA